MGKKKRGIGDADKNYKQTSDGNESHSPVGRESGKSISSESEICIGASCFRIRIPKDRDEVIVEADERECSEEQKKFVNELMNKVMKGCKTVYEYRPDLGEKDEKSSDKNK